MQLRLLIIIPCFNEEAALPLVLSEIENIKPVKGYSLSVVVVNDCSQDSTKAIAKKFNVPVLDLPMNIGIGGAVQTGFKYALEKKFDLAIQLDGDGQHPGSEIHRLVTAFENYAADIIIGSRFIDNKGFQSSLIRRIGIRYFYIINKLFTGNYIYDSTSGFRLFNKKAIAIAAKNYPDDYPEPESLIIFAKAGLIIKEVAVTMRPRLGGTSSINTAASFFYCFKVTMGMLFSYIRYQSPVYFKD